MAVENMFPTEMVDLPSGGKLYPKDSPLAKGQVEIRYMTAADEDLLTNQAYIERGVVVDKLLQSLIVDKSIDYNQILLGDKNALLVAARILGYGAKYEFNYRGEKYDVDLSQLPAKELHPDFISATENRFTFKCPNSGAVLEFKLLTHADDQAVEQELKGLRKINKDNAPELSTRLKYMIISVNGNADRKGVRDFVDKQFLARDSRAFRKYVSELQPDIDMKFYPEDSEEAVDIPITVNFLWPDINV